MSIDLRLLGPVRARLDGTELPVGSARRTAVLCVLALHAGRSVTREQLIAAVWGDDAPVSAVGNVYTYVSTLRQVLEPARDRWAAARLLTSGGGTYQLHLAPDAVDALRFEALREQARLGRAAGDTAAELAALGAALALWHGEALAGVPGPFAEAQRRRLTELRLTTADRYAALLAEAGRHEEAARALRDEPRKRESLLPAAPPSGEQRAIHVSDPRPDSRLTIGRAAEVRRLREATARATRGRGGSIRVRGTPGLGKSALLAAALRGPVPAGCRVGWAACDEVSQHTPGGALLDCLESATGADPGSMDTVDDAVALVRRAAGQGPLVLVVDDLHWADPVTLGAWRALGGEAGGLPLLLVGAARPGSPSVDGLPGEVIELGPLDDAAATALVRGAAPADSEELARILRDAGGNPHYLRLLAGEPGDLAATVEAHLSTFTDDARQVLRAVAFLGAYELEEAGTLPPGCTTADLHAAIGRGLDDLAPALAAGVLTLAGDRLAFRHPVVARTLYRGTPAALRGTLHRSFAERLAAAGAPPERVVAQLLAGDVQLDPGLAAWLTEHVEELAEGAPRIAVAGLRQARTQYALGPDQRLLVTAWLARLLLREGHNAAAEAGWVAVRTTDPQLKGEMRWVAAHTHERRAEFEAAAEVAVAALRERHIAPLWTARLRALLARVRPHLPGNPTMPHLQRPMAHEPRSAEPHLPHPAAHEPRSAEPHVPHPAAHEPRSAEPLLPAAREPGRAGADDRE